MLTALLDGLFDGISIGSVLLLAALGLAIVFGLMGVINLAHGELMMLGAYTTFVVQNLFKPLGEPWFGIYIFVALIAAFCVTALLGLVLERGGDPIPLWPSPRNPIGDLGGQLDPAAVCAQCQLDARGGLDPVLWFIFWGDVDPLATFQL